jgi:hypothetical protein
MADDYDTLKVPDLKKLLKERSIPSTGLTRKAQYIAALRKDDEGASAGRDNATPADQEADDFASGASSVTLPADDPQVEHVESQAEESAEPLVQAKPVNDAPTAVAHERSASSELATLVPTTQEVVGKCLVQPATAAHEVQTNISTLFRHIVRSWQAEALRLLGFSTLLIESGFVTSKSIRRNIWVRRLEPHANGG